MPTEHDTPPVRFCCPILKRDPVDGNTCGIGGAIPPREGRVDASVSERPGGEKPAINAPSPHPARHSASKTRVNALMARHLPLAGRESTTRVAGTRSIVGLHTSCNFSKTGCPHDQPHAAAAVAVRHARRALLATFADPHGRGLGQADTV